MTDRTPFVLVTAAYNEGKFIVETLKALVNAGRLRREGERWVGWATERLALPDSIRDALSLRYDRLSEPAQQVVQLAAVVGAQVPHALLERLTGLEPGALLAAVDELRRERVFEESDGAGGPSYVFHDDAVSGGTGYYYVVQFARRQHNDMQRVDYLARRLVHPAEQLRRRQAELSQLAQRLAHTARTRMTREQLQIAQLNQRLVTPHHAIRREQQQLDALRLRAQRAAHGSLMQRQLYLARYSSSLAHLNPENVLARGYSIVQTESGAVVQDAMALSQGDTLRLRFHHGQARAIVESVDQDATPD